MLVGAKVVGPPTMLIYAEQETEFAQASREKGAKLPSIHKVLEIPDATRLFNDQISLEMMVGATIEWLVDHLTPIRVGEGEAPAAAPAGQTGRQSQVKSGRTE